MKNLEVFEVYKKTLFKRKSELCKCLTEDENNKLWRAKNIWMQNKNVFVDMINIKTKEEYFNLSFEDFCKNNINGLSTITLSIYEKLKVPVKKETIKYKFNNIWN